MGALRRHPFLSAALAIVLAGLVVLGITFVAVWRAAHTDDARTIQRTDAILVLSAAQFNGSPSPVFVGRLEQAALLYREQRAPTIVVLGGNQPGDRTTEGASGREYLVDHGVPSTAVAAVPEGNTTLESLRAAVTWMKTRGMESAFLVSDPWHNLRIKRMAADLGIQGYASATWQSAARSQGTRLDGYVRETFAYLYYRVLGR